MGQRGRGGKGGKGEEGATSQPRRVTRCRAAPTHTVPWYLVASLFVPLPIVPWRLGLFVSHSRMNYRPVYSTTRDNDSHIHLFGTRRQLGKIIESTRELFLVDEAIDQQSLSGWLICNGSKCIDLTERNRLLCSSFLSLSFFSHQIIVWDN